MRCFETKSVKLDYTNTDLLQACTFGMEGNSMSIIMKFLLHSMIALESQRPVWYTKEGSLIPHLSELALISSLMFIHRTPVNFYFCTTYQPHYEAGHSKFRPPRWGMAIENSNKVKNLILKNISKFD